MIEVEKKLQLTAEEEARLLSGATFVSEKTFTDIYYDTADYKLTKEDQWLRERDGKWELKVSRDRSLDRLGDQYEEVTNDTEIVSRLNLDTQGKLNSAFLAEHGFLPFVELTTTRRKYKRGTYTIDCDEVRYAGTDLVYRLAEIEAQATDDAHREEVLTALLAFLKEQNIPVRHTRGKITVYMFAHRPAHAEALVAAGVYRKQEQDMSE